MVLIFQDFCEEDRTCSRQHIQQAVCLVSGSFWIIFLTTELLGGDAIHAFENLIGSLFTAGATVNSFIESKDSSNGFKHVKSKSMYMSPIL